MWIGTENGLNLLDRNTYKFKRFSNNKGFSVDHINSILEDNKGNLFIGTNKGIVKFNLDIQEVLPFTISREIDELEYIKNAAYKTSDGQLYFGSQKGLIAFYPDAIKNDHEQIKTILTNIKLNNKEVVIGNNPYKDTILNKDISLTNSITLDYDNTDLTIYFSALYYRYPQNCEYMYIMEGVDENWKISNSSTHSASYNNLPPGKHIL